MTSLAIGSSYSFFHRPSQILIIQFHKSVSIPGRPVGGEAPPALLLRCDPTANRRSAMDIGGKTFASAELTEIWTLTIALVVSRSSPPTVTAQAQAGPEKIRQAAAARPERACGQ